MFVRLHMYASSTRTRRYCLCLSLWVCMAGLQAEASEDTADGLVERGQETSPISEEDRGYWAFRRLCRSPVAEIISREKVDIAGLQEVTHRQLNDLKKRLPKMQVYGVGRDDGKTRGEYAPIFFRSDRFELLEKSTFWLSKTKKTISPCSRQRFGKSTITATIYNGSAVGKMPRNGSMATHSISLFAISISKA